MRIGALGFGRDRYETKTNPIPWINTWLSSDAVQVAPQEVELSSYLTGAIDTKVDAKDFSGFSL
jgi:ribonucleoside-diphosphate reductase beta chain